MRLTLSHVFPKCVLMMTFLPRSMVGVIQVCGRVMITDAPGFSPSSIPPAMAAWMSWHVHHPRWVLSRHARDHLRHRRRHHHAHRQEQAHRERARVRRKQITLLEFTLETLALGTRVVSTRHERASVRMSHSLQLAKAPLLQSSTIFFRSTKAATFWHTLRCCERPANPRTTKTGVETCSLCIWRRYVL